MPSPSGSCRSTRMAAYGVVATFVIASSAVIATSVRNPSLFSLSQRTTAALGSSSHRQEAKVRTRRQARWHCDRLLPNRELNAKDRAAAGRLVEAGLPTEPVDDALYDAQTESSPALVALIRGVGLCELLEDVSFKFVGDAVAVVSHRNSDGPALHHNRNEHFFIRRRELDGIRQEISDDLREPVRVRPDIGGDGCRAEPKPHFMALGESVVGFYHLLDERFNLDAFKVENDLTRLQLLDIEDVVYLANKPLTVFVCAVQQTFLRLWETARLEHDGLSIFRHNQGLRCSKLLTDEL